MAKISSNKNIKIQLYKTSTISSKDNKYALKYSYDVTLRTDMFKLDKCKTI